MKTVSRKGIILSRTLKEITIGSNLDWFGMSNPESVRSFRVPSDAKLRDVIL